MSSAVTPISVFYNFRVWRLWTWRVICHQILKITQKFMQPSQILNTVRYLEPVPFSCQIPINLQIAISGQIPDAGLDIRASLVGGNTELRMEEGNPVKM